MEFCKRLKGKRNIVDIKAELLLVKSKNVPGGAIFSTTKIPLEKKRVFILSRYDKKNTNADFAGRFVTEEALHKLWSDDESQFLIFRVYSHDEISGFGKIFIKEYRIKRNSLIQGQYNFGDDLEIS